MNPDATARHRSSGARVRPGPPRRRRRRRGRLLHAPAVGGPAPGRVDPRRASALRRHRRSRSPAPVRRWSRSSAWPSSRSRSGCRPRPARSTWARPSSCGTGSRSTWARVGPVTCGVAGPADRPRHHRALGRGGGVRGLPGRAVRAPDPTRRGGPAGRGRDRPVHARPRSSGAGRPLLMAGTSRSSTPRCPLPAPSYVQGELDLADALDLETRAQPTPPCSPTSARPASWTCAGPRRSGQIARQQHVVGPRHQTARPERQVVLHVHLSADAITARTARREAAPGPGGEHPLASSTSSRSASGAAPPAPR